MVTVILVSFEYRNLQNSDFEKLEGSLFDLYNSFNHFKKLGYNVYILSDIAENYLKFDSKKEHDIILTDFIQYVSDNLVVSNVNIGNFIRALNRILKIRDDKFIFYYSGHGSLGNIVLPNYEKMPISEIINVFSLSTEKNSQIFMIMDCCEVCDLKLPFILNENSFEYIQNSKFYDQFIVLISSSSKNQKSISTTEGSIFTKFFLTEKKTFNFFECKKMINDNIKNYVDVFIKNNKIEKFYQIPTINLYSSYIVFPILWPWVFENFTEIIPDYTLSYLYSKN